VECHCTASALQAVQWLYSDSAGRLISGMQEHFCKVKCTLSAPSLTPLCPHYSPPPPPQFPPLPSPLSPRPSSLAQVASNTVINTCGSHMAVEEALALLRAMQRRGQRPNQVTLNHVLGILVKAGRMEDAQELFEVRYPPPP